MDFNLQLDLLKTRKGAFGLPFFIGTAETKKLPHGAGVFEGVFYSPVMMRSTSSFTVGINPPEYHGSSAKR